MNYHELHALTKGLSRFNRELSENHTIVLDGHSLTPEQLVSLGHGDSKIRISDQAMEAIKRSRQVVQDILNSGSIAYGINTGFGKFASEIIPPEKVKQLQVSLIRSHAAGVGDPLSLFYVRMLFALRINTLAKGFSGVSLETYQAYVDAFNASCLSWVPTRGSVGASGDLAPLAHLALGMIGEGQMWSPKTDWGDAKHVLKENGLDPIHLQAKDGLSLINGTQFITSLGAHALVKAETLAYTADIVTAMTVEALKCTHTAYNENIHRVRPHPGQNLVAARLRALLHSAKQPSEIWQSHSVCHKVQDAYSIRCVPQVHGIVWDTIRFVRGILQTEINSATDNPLVFSSQGLIMSGGNFHGEYPAKVLDYLAIAVQEFANISERRIERLVNPDSSNLPAFLTKEGGLNSGFMMAHVTAAALTSENKVLCHPSSVDSISTSAGQEDHVSMGPHAARKALEILHNCEYVLAIELLCATQAMDFHRPLKSTEPLERVYHLVRSVSTVWEVDRFMQPEIEKVAKLIRDGDVWNCVKDHIETYVKENMP